MLEVLLLLASLHDGPVPCKPIEEWASAYANKLHGHGLRELPADGVARFNSKPPPTDFEQVWLLDIEGPQGEKAGMVFAGHDDQACYTGILKPRDWDEAIKHLEPRT